MDGMECDASVADLPVSNPLCVQAAECCTAFYAAENASQAATPFAGQFEYGHWVTYYWVIILGLLTILHAFWTIIDRRGQPLLPSPSRASTSLWDKSVSAFRSISYRRLTRGNRYLCISVPGPGMSAFFLVTCIFIIILVFAERPYYRPQFGYGSPPIAIRSGLMAFACVPIGVALAGKANIVTMLTGISHERLNVVHQWVSWISFGLSLVHTIPFFIASVRDPGNGGMQRVKSEFYRYGPTMGLSEYSGTPALAVLFGLCFLSLPQIRRRFYESFYVVHILLAVSYLGLLFWHAGDELDSWAYLWATLAVWLASWFARAFWYHRCTSVRSTNWFQTCPATLNLIDGSLVRIEVERPVNFGFAPGQHCFLRFSSAGPLESHPFTIASAPNDAVTRVFNDSTSSDGSEIEKGQANSVVNSTRNHFGTPGLLFIVKVREGFTRKLASHCDSLGKGGACDTAVALDGPYGGLPYSSIEKLYDSLLLVAGGSGISACLSWLSHVVSLSDDTPKTRLRAVSLVWAIRDMGSINWVSKELRRAHDSSNSRLHVDIRVYVTGSNTPPPGLTSTSEEQENGADTGGSKGSNAFDKCEASTGAPTTMVNAVVRGRPDLDGAVTEAALGARERLFVFGSGPFGMNCDLSNACASAQRHVLSGQLREIGMHIETFDW